MELWRFPFRVFGREVFGPDCRKLFLLRRLRRFPGISLWEMREVEGNGWTFSEAKALRREGRQRIAGSRKQPNCERAGRRKWQAIWNVCTCASGGPGITNDE